MLEKKWFLKTHYIFLNTSLISFHWWKFLVAKLYVLENEVPSSLFGKLTSPWPNSHYVLLFIQKKLKVRYVSDTVESIQFSSVTQSCLTLCDPHGLQHTRLPCPSPTPEACWNLCPSNQWCHGGMETNKENEWHYVNMFRIYGTTERWYSWIN